MRAPEQNFLNRRLRAAETFAGSGRLGVAVKEVFDSELVWFSEVDPGACKVLERRFPGVPNLGDITAIDWAAVPPIEILSGGFPCTDLSPAGKRAGIGPGTRSGLWSYMADAISHLRPLWGVAENVQGLLSLGIDVVLRDLADRRYTVRWIQVSAAEVGAPHLRKRLAILACREALPQPVSAKPVCRLVEGEWVTIGGRRDGQAFTGKWPRTGTMIGDTVYSVDPAIAAAPSEPIEPAPNLLLPTPTATSSGNPPEVHLRKKPGRKRVTDLRIIAENGLFATGGELPDASIPLLPTPIATESKGRTKPSGRTRADGRTRTAADGRLSDAVDALLPTPRAMEHKQTMGSRGAARHVEKGMGGLTEVIGVELLPTPRATRGGSTTEIAYALGAERDDTARPQGEALLPTPTASDSVRRADFARAERRGTGSDDLVTTVVRAARGRGIDWGKYTPAIQRWERILGRLAPSPTEPNRNGRDRLAAVLPEWMMGWPSGWVTDPELGLSREQQLRAIGNGVVDRQIAHGLRQMLRWRNVEEPAPSLDEAAA
ncbi:Modification methylase BanI (plasmid) [Tsukamurella tyrosinosolvens]|uniref:DNA (Cytosine-5)-methyltransferase 1 n=1 Tax=Tsukamurella tyrosinosolvens TaxID=57704 RepID=A0A1H4UIB2_TSUTY|nr:DNA cytosine methyltransferase [Tsukamurella tyrosinosolvens]SEC67884.1 DNA (cytosine-5)-methyltransferase 1 [Tsukamurella tyrosinosolvens]VEH94213.1 Modification methylase BanI [Tsukamurella tyrosinosolvens]